MVCDDLKKKKRKSTTKTPETARAARTRQESPQTQNPAWQKSSSNRTCRLPHLREYYSVKQRSIGDYSRHPNQDIVLIESFVSDAAGLIWPSWGEEGGEVLDGLEGWGGGRGEITTTVTFAGTMIASINIYSVERFNHVITIYDLGS